jgi:hypothetical protein
MLEDMTVSHAIKPKSSYKSAINWFAAAFLTLEELFKLLEKFILWFGMH